MPWWRYPSSPSSGAIHSARSAHLLPNLINRLAMKIRIDLIEPALQNGESRLELVEFIACGLPPFLVQRSGYSLTLVILDPPRLAVPNVRRAPVGEAYGLRRAIDCRLDERPWRPRFSKFVKVGDDVSHDGPPNEIGSVLIPLPRPHPHAVFMVAPYPVTTLPPSIPEKARTAALLGTRALIAESRFDALVALLVASGAVPTESAQTMLTDLGDTMRAHARAGRHDEFQIASAELQIEAQRLAARADGLRCPK